MLSIIIPIYNAETYLKECIDSVINQTYHEFELLLVDDGSTDGSLEICREYEQADNRISILLGEHRGPYYARKLGVEKASGDYITFLDADDFVAETAYILAKNDMALSVDIISFDIIRYFADSSMRYDQCNLPEKIYGRKEIEREIFPVLIWNAERNTFGLDPSLVIKIYRAEFIKEWFHMPRNISFHYGEDVAVIYPLLMNAASVSVHHQAYYYHRQRPQNVIPPYIKDEKYLDKLYDLYKHLSISMAEYPLFQRQIDLFFSQSAQLVKRKYGISTYVPNNIFPFDKVPKGSRVIIYGAGNIGKLYFRQLKMLDYCHCVLWVDRDYKQLGGKIHNPEEISASEYDIIVIAIVDINVKNKVKEYLTGLGVQDDNIV